MAATRRSTDDVLTAARDELQAQLSIVREEIARLSAEENALTLALASFNGDGSPSTPGSPARKAASIGRTPRASSPRRVASGNRTRRRRQRAASKSTADRVEDLRGLLADGPKSRSDLAAALKVSPARVQQLLAELGGSVSSRPDPEDGRGKLWSLKGARNGTVSSRPKQRAGAGGKRTATRKPTARRRRVTK